MNVDLHVIEDSAKIVNTLDLLSRTKSILSLRNLLTEYNGRISSIKNDQFVFSPNIIIISLQEQLQFSFFYLDKYHYFNAKLIEVKKKDLLIKIPNKIFIHYRRKDKRYSSDKSEITCNIKIINVKDGHRDSVQIKRLFKDIEYVYKELENDSPDFNKVVRLITENNKSFCNEFKFFMPVFNLQFKPLIPFISEMQKPFLINSTIDKDSYLKPSKDENVLTMKNYIEFLSNTGNPQIPEEINKLIDYYKQKSYYSVLYIPIIVLDKVVGALEIVNTMSRKIKFDIKIVKYFMSMGELFNELIIKNKLNSLDDDTLKIEVNDISVSGIGIEITDNVFLTFVKKDAKVKVFLNYKDEPWLSFVGQVKRVTKKDEINEIGITIFEILPENKMKLVEYINKHFINVDGN